MRNAIPDKYIFSCELFRNVERIAIADFGSSDIDGIKAVIIKKMAKERNTILFDLYQQILIKVTQHDVVIK
ncbi:hypothetical protein ACXNAL_20525 [Kluyvera ascorbata]|jgi:hypothetical protein|uniref:Uncharacterized protein n=1 Tax=Kluyvera ascorbata TaxID=51288 RepID=A0AB35X406_9ENTR|nr:hypothetical protein STW0522KLE44_26170 [Klebsiella sp. STW0522-44]HCL5623745.1 hypothetical protein [Kluyvera ascorbata]HDG1668216.1 hypothetical protein [Kluyvera ascorbata]HED3203527.1 hypothetical protein [Kluyvera ascorbata]HED4089637.1 hypothetical protein [Kluyvera ascorbata]